MHTPRDEIRRIIRRALDDARPEAARRVASAASLTGGLPLAFTPKRGSGGPAEPRGMFSKKLVLGHDARAAFDPEVVLACYNALRLAARQAGGLATVQEFSDPDEPQRRLAFTEAADHVLAFVPRDNEAT